MKIQKEKLLVLAAIVWLAAGINILRIGLICYSGRVTAINLLLSALVLAAFWRLIFRPLVAKHTARILHYTENRQWFYRFFDAKSFSVMAVMMTVGIGLRALHLAPDTFIAVFYTGLGIALSGAGIRFGYQYRINRPSRRLRSETL